MVTQSPTEIQFESLVNSVRCKTDNAKYYMEQGLRALLIQ